MEVQQYMTKDVKTCTENDSVSHAVAMMAEYNIGSIIIIKDKKPFGIFSERDLVKRVVALGKDPDKVLIGNVMTRDLISIDAEDSVGHAYHILVKNNVRHAPVVKSGKLVGIVSQRDLAKVIDERFYVTYFGNYGKRDLSGEY